MNHGGKTPYEMDQAYPKWWDWFVHYQVDMFKKYFDTLLQHCIDEEQNPIYFSRYEDLCADMEGTTRGPMMFLLDMDTAS